MDRPKVNAVHHVAAQGLRAALGLAGVAGAVAFGASVLQPPAAEPVATTPPRIDATVTAEAPVETAVAAAPVDQLVFTPLGAAEDAALLTMTLDELSLASPADAVPRTALDLSHRRAGIRRGGPARAYAPQDDNRLEALAEDLAPDWRAPTSGDVSLFVAGDDEAVGWALTKRAGQARVTYQEDRVEVGELSAGVAMTLSDSQLALAYVERDAPAQFGYAPRENMAGVVWTLRR